MKEGDIEFAPEGDKVFDDYDHDYSIFKIRPKAIAFPKNSGEVRKLVGLVSERKKAGELVSLTARAGGTDMTGGPLTSSIVLSLTRYFNKILEIGRDFVRVQPGVYFRDLEEELGKTNLFYPAYPASKDICAVGGMVANNSGGEKTLAYGKTEKYVWEMKAVLADGNEYVIKPLLEKDLDTKIRENTFEGGVYKNIYELILKNRALIEAARPKVSKNSAGYALWNVYQNNVFDLAQLLVGSQGTLGIITEVKLGVLPIPKYSKLAAIFLKDLSRLGDIVVESLKYKPVSLESYDDKTFRLALRFIPGLIRLMGGNAFLLGLSFLPEIVLLLRGGIPKMVILAEFSGDEEEEVIGRVRNFSAGMKGFGGEVRVMKNEREAEKYKTIRRQSFKLLHEHSKDCEAAAFIDDVIVRPEFLPEFLPKLAAILDPHKKEVAYTIAGHPGSGNFHIIPLMDLKNPIARALIPKLSEEVYSLVLRYEGSITAEHNDGLVRTPYLEKMFGSEMVGLFQRVKNIFDPLGIFNPGKKVGGDMNYSLSQIKR